MTIGDEGNGEPKPFGSAIGGQFEPPNEPLLPIPPPPPATTPNAVSDGPAWVRSTPDTGYVTPPNPVHYPETAPEFVDDLDRPSKLPWLIAVAATVFLLGAGGLFAVSAFGATGGASSPDEGIEAVLAAVGDEDFVTLAELMEPTERRTLAEPAITELLPELVRLGVLDDSVDASNVDGVDLVFTDVEYRVERLVGVNDIAHVFLTSGEVATTVNGAALPFTNDIDTSDLDQRQEITESETPLVFVQRDGDWFFSLWFSLAENARLAANERLPSIDESPAQMPSESPEAAIEGMFTSMTNFDLRSLVGHMDPEEMAVLYRYSPLFLDEAQAELDSLSGDLRDEGATWEMTDFDFDVEQDGDDAVVTLRGFTVNFAVDQVELSMTYSRDQLDGTLDFDGITGSLQATTTDYVVDGQVDRSEFDAAISIEPDANRISGTARLDGDTFDGELVLDPTGECSRYELSGSDGTNESGCLEDDAGVDGIAPILEAMEEWPEEFPGFSMRARQVDDGWFVSPVGTIFDGVITSLEGLEEGDFNNVFDPFAGIAGDAAADPFGILDGTGIPGPGAVEQEELDPFDLADDAATEEFVESFTDSELEDETMIDVALGETADFIGDVGDNGFDAFAIELDAGSPVVITAQAPDSSLDTTLRIVDPAGNEAAFNDDARIDVLSTSFDSQVTFTPTTSGLHVLEVAGFGTSSGAYVLTVDRARTADAGTPAEGNVVLDRGQTVEVVGEVVAPVRYGIDLEAGDEIVITVEANSGNLDPVVSLLLDEIEIGRNDDALDSSAVADSFDSQLIVSVPGGGSYTILVEGFAGTAGDFTMTISNN